VILFSFHLSQAEAGNDGEKVKKYKWGRTPQRSIECQTANDKYKMYYDCVWMFFFLYSFKTPYQGKAAEGRKREVPGGRSAAGGAVPTLGTELRRGPTPSRQLSGERGGTPKNKPIKAEKEGIPSSIA
jgi:hypothetical protein